MIGTELLAGLASSDNPSPNNMDERVASRNWHREAIRPGEGSGWPVSNCLRNWHRKTVRLRASDGGSYFAELASRDNLLFARPNCLRNWHRKTTRSWGGKMVHGIGIVGGLRGIGIAIGLKCSRNLHRERSAHGIGIVEGCCGIGITTKLSSDRSGTTRLQDVTSQDDPPRPGT